MTVDSFKHTPAFLIVDGSKVFVCTKPIIKIGRSTKNDLVLEYQQVSRHHAEIRYSKGYYEILDLNSTGGTYVNDEKITKQILHKGDVITLADIHLVFGQDEVPPSGSTEEYQPPPKRATLDIHTQALPHRRSKNQENS
jgi:pSer/pThr/pTyr-binding forkhead associated (FHA) protein